MSPRPENVMFHIFFFLFNFRLVFAKKYGPTKLTPGQSDATKNIIKELDLGRFWDDFGMILFL